MFPSNRLRFAFGLLGLLTATFGAVACGSISPTTPPNARLNSMTGRSYARHDPSLRIEHRTNKVRSWMLPEASSTDLLYVTNLHNVTIYSYPVGKLVGKLKDFYVADGECVDAKQNVWIGDAERHSEVQYAHGSTKPQRELTDTDGIGCAVDPSTGNLALTTLKGDVFVYKAAQGKPDIYTSSRITKLWFCSYDNKGDLFASGSKYSTQKDFELVELAKASRSLDIVTVDHTITYPGGIQWDGKHLAVGDAAKPVVYEFDIRGKRGILVGTTPLGKPAKFIYDFFLDGSRLIAPNNYGDGDNSDVLYYNYPLGGSPTRRISKGMQSNEAAVVSDSVTH